MDWLSASHTVIDCHKRDIVFQFPGQPKFEFYCGSRILKPAVARARPIDGTLNTLDGKKGQISIVSDFQDVFFKEYGLLAKKSVKLSIDLISGATPILRIPYHMSRIELEEVKPQVDDLLSKGYIRSSVSLSVIGK